MIQISANQAPGGYAVGPHRPRACPHEHYRLFCRPAGRPASRQLECAGQNRRRAAGGRVAGGDLLRAYRRRSAAAHGASLRSRAALARPLDPAPYRLLPVSQPCLQSGRFWPDLSAGPWQCPAACHGVKCHAAGGLPRLRRHPRRLRADHGGLADGLARGAAAPWQQSGSGGTDHCHVHGDLYPLGWGRRARRG